MHRPFTPQGDRDDQDEVKNPTVEDVDAFIGSLDGERFDQVWLEARAGDETVTLAVEGAAATGMTLTITANQHHHRLVDAGKPSDREDDIASGGILVQRPASWIVSVSAVQQAVRCFLTTSVFDDSQEWVSSPSVRSEPRRHRKPNP